MKIYVVEQGQYSDRHIIGVTDDKKKAEKVCGALDAWYSEWDTDQFEVRNCLRFEVYDPNCSYDSDWTAVYDAYDLYDNYKENTELDDGVYIIYADSREQAIKIAQDMRAEKLARKNGII